MDEEHAEAYQVLNQTPFAGDRVAYLRVATGLIPLWRYESAGVGFNPDYDGNDGSPPYAVFGTLSLMNYQLLVEQGKHSSNTLIPKRNIVLTTIDSLVVGEDILDHIQDYLLGGEETMITVHATGKDHQITFYSDEHAVIDVRPIINCYAARDNDEKQNEYEKPLRVIDMTKEVSGD